MYQSRYHATNGLISIAVDACNGELLELTLERTWDNLIKNHVPMAYSPFVLEMFIGDEQVTAHPPRYADICADPTLAPVITVDQQEDSACVQVDYPAVVSDKGRHAVRVRVKIALPAGECRSVWHLEMENTQEHTEVQRALFPCIEGVWLGDT
ncbi:MAG: hypothetical protein RR482_08095, partial [Clostridia bacterium]